MTQGGQAKDSRVAAARSSICFVTGSLFLYMGLGHVVPPLVFSSGLLSLLPSSSSSFFVVETRFLLAVSSRQFYSWFRDMFIIGHPMFQPWSLRIRERVPVDREAPAYPKRTRRLKNFGKGENGREKVKMESHSLGC